MIDYEPFAKYILQSAEVWYEQTDPDTQVLVLTRVSDGYVYFWPATGAFHHSYHSPERLGYVEAFVW